MPDRSFTVRLSARVDAYVNAIREAEKATLGFSRTTQRNLSRIGTQLQSVGRMTTVGVTVPIVAAGAAAVKAGMDWESAFTGVEKTVDGSADQIARLESELRSMTERLPSSHTQIAAIAEAAGQLGIHVDDVAEFTETMVMLGDTTNIIGQQGALDLARLMNVMGTASSDVGRLGATIVDLGNNTATTEAEILELGTRISGAGRIAGLSEADVLSLAAALTSVGVRAEAGGTAVSKMLLHMRDAVNAGGKELSVFAQVAGMTMDEFAAAFRDDAAMAFSSFIEGIGRVGNSTQALDPIFEALALKDERLMRSMRDLSQAGGDLGDTIALGRNAWEENTALIQEAERRYATFASKVAILRNKAVELGIDLAAILIPILEKVITVVGWGVDAFRAMPTSIQGTIMVVAALVAIIGPLILITGTMMRNIQALIALKTAWAGASVAASGGLATLTASSAAATAAMSGLAAATSAAFAVAAIGVTAFASWSPVIHGLRGDTDWLYRDVSALEKPFQAISKWSFETFGGSKPAWKYAEEYDNQAKELYATMTQGVYTTDQLATKMWELGLDTEVANRIMIAYADQLEANKIAQDNLAEAQEAERIELEADNAAKENAELLLERVSAEMDAMVESIEAEADALRDSIEAWEEKADAYRSAADATFALHDAEDRYAESVAKLNVVLGDEKATLTDIRQAQDNVAESARDMADAQVRIAEETALAEGSVLTATAKLDLFNESLLDQAAVAEGPARDAILNYIADVNGISEERATMVKLLVDSGLVAQAEYVLNNASRSREALVQAEADSASLKLVESQLAWLERSRSVNLKITASGGGSGLVRYMDKGGMGRPGDVVAERGPEIVDGQLVTRPVVLTRSARIIGREDTAKLLESDRADALSSFTGLGASVQPMSSHAASSTVGDPVVVEVMAPTSMVLNVDGASMTAHVESVVYQRERREAGRR